MSNATIHVISSMATRQVLGELVDAWQQHTHESVRVESVGGVDAARRVQMGEPFDIAVLASDAIGKLIAAGKLVAASEVALAHSGVAVAVRRGRAPRRTSIRKLPCARPCWRRRPLVIRPGRAAWR